MKQSKLFLAVALCSSLVATGAFAMSVSVAHVSSVAHVATVPHVVAPHVTAPAVHIAEPVVTHAVAPEAPAAPKAPSRPSFEPKSEVYRYPPKVTTVYVPHNAHYVVPRGAMQNFCADPEAYRKANPISFSEDEFRGMVDACFRAKQEGKEPGDYIK